MIYIRITRGRDCSLLVCLFHFSCNRFSTYYFYRAHIDVRSLMKKNGAPFIFRVACVYAMLWGMARNPCMYVREEYFGQRHVFTILYRESTRRCIS